MFLIFRNSSTTCTKEGEKNPTEKIGCLVGENYTNGVSQLKGHIFNDWYGFLQ